MSTTLSPDHAGGGRARAAHRECRDHLGLDPRSAQRGRGARPEMPHHHGSRGCVEELPGLGSKTGAELSLDAVKAFRDDALAARLSLDLSAVATS